MDRKDIIAFEKSFDRASKEAMYEAKEVVRKSITDLCYTIVKRTPVGDLAAGRALKGPNYIPGNLKGNWRISFGSPENGEIDRKDPSGTKVMAEVKASMSAFILSDTVYFVNNTSYANLIENYGRSAKAPEGMMKISVLDFNNIVKTNASKLGKI